MEFVLSEDDHGLEMAFRLTQYPGDQNNQLFSMSLQVQSLVVRGDRKSVV